MHDLALTCGCGLAPRRDLDGYEACAEKINRLLALAQTVRGARAQQCDPAPDISLTDDTPHHTYRAPVPPQESGLQL